MILLTGGAGFIGANFIINWLEKNSEPVLNVDKLTYAGNVNSLVSVTQNPRHIFVKADICNTRELLQLLVNHTPRAILHLAAETHVDRSIFTPRAFVNTNVNGTFSLLEAARNYWLNLPSHERSAFRFLHISTDEVYGDLPLDAAPFTENSPYLPNNPYAASKAASNHLVRAYHHTFGLPTLITHCSNNYGAFQFPEKLIPLMISNARAGRALPLYGDGLQLRNWLYVTDHCTAVRSVLEKGSPGQTYNIGSQDDKTNLNVVQTICDVLDKLDPKGSGSYRNQIVHVADRPGHDRRYSIDTSKIERELDWFPTVSFAQGIQKTVQWYLDHDSWLKNAQVRASRKLVEQTRAQRFFAKSKNS